MKDFWGLSKSMNKWNNEEMMKIKQREREISIQIENLKFEEDNLEQQSSIMKREHLKPVLGMCFRDTAKSYALIYKLPEEEWDSFHQSHINFYQLPIYKIDLSEENKSIYTDTMYSRAVEAFDPCACLAEEYEQISTQEFMDKMAQVCKHISKFFVDNL